MPDGGAASREAVRRRRIRRVVSPLLGLSAWHIASVVVGRSIILPSPRETLVELSYIVLSPTFGSVVGATVVRVLASFAISLLASLAIGIAAGLWPAVEDTFHAPITITRSVPTMGIILLSLIWLDSEGAPLLVAALVSFPIMYASVVTAIRAIDPLLAEMNTVFGIGLFRRVREFYVPSMVPHLRAGVAAALGLTVKVMIAAEVLSQPNEGIGTMFQIERARLNTPGVFAWCLVVIVIAGTLDLVLTRLSGRGSARYVSARAA